MNTAFATGAILCSRGPISPHEVGHGLAFAVVMSTLDRKPAPLKLRLEAVPRSVPAARSALADYARTVGAPPDDVELAVAEATSNSILHGYTERDPGHIDLSAEVDSGELLVTVADDGDGMRPHPQGGGLGLGLALIGQMTTSVTIRTPPVGGTELRMTFPLGAAA
jgi:anti-sigma regulatory factor (Ser/Thr protein kinase)